MNIAISADPPDDPRLQAAARQTAAAAGLPMEGSGMSPDGRLVVTPPRLELRLPGDQGLPLSVDWSQVQVRSAAGRTLRQPLARALGIKSRSQPMPVVIDVTAGWGEDAWLMANFGCTVLAVERHRVMFLLLADGLRRAAELNAEAAARIQLRCRDSITLLGSLGHLPDDLRLFRQPQVIYLDPMFPLGRKTAERKPMKVLRQMVGNDADASSLLKAARQSGARRVVVKRPLRAAPLAESPSHHHAGKSLRYDVYMTLE